MKRKFLFAMLCIVSALGLRAQTWTGNAASEGTFYLYNVGAEKFLNNGDPAQSWGTNAYLQAGFGLDIILEANGEAYNLNTNVSNGGNSHYLATSTWCDGAPTPWIFTPVAGQTNVYTISNGGKYLIANNELNDVYYGDLTSADDWKMWWKLVSENDFKAAMQAKTYSTTDPMDVSVFIKGRSFARNDGRNSNWTTTHNGGNWVWIGSSADKYYGNEAWNNTFDVHQAIADLPDGTYEVQCSGFGTNGTTYIYGNTTAKAIQTDNTTSRGTSKEAKWTAIHEDNAFAGQSTGKFTLSGGNLTVGIKRETNNGGDWCVYDEFRLYYYGLDLSEFAATLADAVAAAQAVEGTVPTAAYDALAAVVTENNKTYTTAADYSNAANAIINATNAATVLQSNYSRYKNVRVAVLAINDGIDVSAANTSVEAATTNEEINAAVATLRTALSNYLTNANIENDQIDLTAALIDNPAPGESGTTDYWTNSSNPGLQYQLFEFYNLTSATSKQVIETQLPIGYYALTVIGYTRDEDYNGFIYAGGNEQLLVGAPRSTVNNLQQGSNWIANGNGVNTLTFGLTAATSNLEIGINSGTAGDKWTVWRSFKLEYLGTAPLALYQGQLADAVAAAQTHAGEITIPAAAFTTYYQAINAAAANNSTIADCQSGIAAIAAATTAADAWVAPYAAYLSASNYATFAGVATTTIEDQNEAVATATDISTVTAATATLQAATDALAIDITSFTITNPTAQTKDGWEGTDFGGQSDNVCEYWNISGADFHQTLAALPVGKYRLTVVALQRTGMTGVVYAGANTTTIAQAATSVANSRAQANTWFNAGNGRNYVVFEVTGDPTDVTIGLTADATTGDHWTVWQSFKLETFNENVAASYLAPGYNDAMAAAVAYQTVDMFDADKAALNTAISENTVDPASATIAGYETAIANLNAATAAAAAAAARYTQYNEIVAAIGGNTNVDLTSFVVNADFQENSLNGWTSVDGGNVANNGNFNSTYFVERWKNGVALGNGSLTHDAVTLPAGVYRITADAQNIEQYNSGAAGTGLFLCANAEQTEIGAKGNYDVYVKVADKEALTIKFLQDNCTGNWIAYDNVTLTYVDADYTYALVDGKMNAGVADAQTAAKNAFDANENGTTYKALVNAIATAQASKDAYTAAAAALTKANEILNSTNVYTTAARTAYVDAIAAAQTAYDDASMETTTANALNATLNVADWGTTPAPLAADYVGSAWTGTNINNNFWSWEGDAVDASGMSTPFVQAWVADAEKLADNTITATLTELENGLYSVTAFMRVFNSKTTEGDTGYEGVTLTVNDGTAVAFAEATQYTDGYAKEITAEGLVKNGNLIIKVGVENTNASWLAFKNVNYTKVRDLTPEEESVAPTAIALYEGEEDVTGTTVVLKGAQSTLTLTPVYTPSETTEGLITWESSNENVATVANGVVRVNGTGTATITVKSTLDESVTATVNVLTYGFKNQSFEADGNMAAGNGTDPKLISITGWEQTQSTPNSYQDNQLRDANTDNSSNYGKRVTPSDGSYYLFYRHGWNGSNSATFTSDVQTLPIGLYTLSVDYKMVSGSDNSSNNDNTAITLSAINGENVLGTSTRNDAIKANNNSSTAYLTNNAWSTLTTTFTLTEATEVQAVINLLACGPKRSDFVVDNVTLNWESIRSALGEQLAEANAIDVTSNVGTEPFQISQSAADALTNAIATAQGVYNDGEASEADIIAQINTLKVAEQTYAEAELNAPDETAVYHIVVATTGHAKEGNPIIIVPGNTSANNPTGYGLNCNQAANINLAQAFTFKKVSGNSYTISTQTAEGEVYLTNGSMNGSAAGWANSQIQATADATKAMEFQIAASATDGAFNIYNTVTNSTIACQTGGNIYTESGNADFRLVETDKPVITINTTAAGWGTTMLPFAVTNIPEGVKVYSCATVDGDVLTLTEVDAIEANKPYIIEGAWSEDLTGDAQGVALTYTDGLLTGVYAAQSAPNESYVLQKNGGKVGFYQVDEAVGLPTVGANRAYLTAPAGGEVKVFFLGTDADAIRAIEAEEGNDVIYNLAGQRVSKAQKGIFIKNGKKVVVK